MTSVLHDAGGVRLNQYDTHVPCTILKRDFPQKFEGYFKFAFIRNPWDRMYSMYKFTLRRGWMPKTTTYEEFLERDELHITEACKYQEPIVPITKKPQMDFISNEAGKILVDYIGRFENLESDFQKICSHIGMQCSLPHVNASPGVHYREAYTATTKSFIETFFQKDIETFNYEF